MPAIIPIANQKGGVGKSMVAINLYHALKSHVRAVFFDIDPQGTAIEAAILNDTYQVTPYLDQDLRQLDTDVVIIDTPPYLSDSLQKILLYSDLVIVPTKASLADVLGIRKTISLIKSAQSQNPNLQAAVLYNMVKYGTTLTEEVQTQVDTFDMPSFNTFIYDRTNYNRSIGIDNGIYGMNDTKAEKEFDAFVKEVLLALQTKNYFANQKSLKASAGKKEKETLNKKKAVVNH